MLNQNDFLHARIISEKNNEFTPVPEEPVMASSRHHSKQNVHQTLMPISLLKIEIALYSYQRHGLSSDKPTNYHHLPIKHPSPTRIHLISIVRISHTSQPHSTPKSNPVIRGNKAHAFCLKPTPALALPTGEDYLILEINATNTTYYSQPHTCS
ncbi:uncharacterized protein BO96DRAFT_467693 [Aspergillus niger CBS 101883]|uniref:uncharacterized protein n=1 Tax=Aspergillus lacticoffeatus (strain CBS 101883) TaxID=1450533 RepID=UPI000D7F9690|nr:uncharacterized protein BO96DRAFT_467693 [Aspergillus niger CBS 101883]PYH54423.1 hypothetical protein BO96DRAFT_467693 [Aspergillus niger CBS 101883]